MRSHIVRARVALNTHATISRLHLSWPARQLSNKRSVAWAAVDVDIAIAWWARPGPARPGPARLELDWPACCSTADDLAAIKTKRRCEMFWWSQWLPVQSADYLSSSLSCSYIRTYWLLPMDIGMCVCTLFQYFHFYHKTICWCATFKAFPIFLCSFAFIRCTFCNKVASRSFIVATAATAAAAPQRPKHSISLYIFYCLKQRIEKRKEEGEREKKTHCRTLWSCLQMSLRTTSGQVDYPHVARAPIRHPSCSSCLLSVRLSLVNGNGCTALWLAWAAMWMV